jgi:hypothetical protein
MKIFSLKIEYAPAANQEYPVKAAESLKGSSDDPNDLYKNLAAHLPAGLCIFRMENPADDRSLCLIYANPAVEQITGLNPEAILGTTPDEKPGNLRSLLPKIAETIQSDKSFNRKAKCVMNAAYRQPHAEYFPLPERHAGLFGKHHQTPYKPNRASPAAGIN